jgi:uncharacterized protein YbjQ (UPF0145 family)
MPQYCTHSLRERRSLGWDINSAGHEVCRGCGLETAQSVQAARVGESPESFEEYERRNRRSALDNAPLLVVTTNDVPGYRIEHVYGDVFGLTVRARNYFANLGASMRTLVGGEVAGYTKMLSDSRHEARERLTEEARKLGANAIVAMRFDCNEIGDVMSEIAAYGTAVTIRKIAPPDDLPV